MNRIIKRPCKGEKGFTLVELMLVVIIISVLVAMIVPRMAGRSEEARVAVAKADVELNVATALKLYELDNGSFPTSEEGLDALMAAPSSAKNWKGPYIEKSRLTPGVIPIITRARAPTVPIMIYIPRARMLRRGPRTMWSIGTRQNKSLTKNFSVLQFL